LSCGTKKSRPVGNPKTYVVINIILISYITVQLPQYLPTTKTIL
jgi:hypothetical protein